MNTISFREYSNLINEGLDVPVKSIVKLAKQHNKPLDYMHKQLKIGIKIEKEHTTSKKDATKIALAHLGEKPNYYSLLKKHVE